MIEIIAAIFVCAGGFILGVLVASIRAKRHWERMRKLDLIEQRVYHVRIARSFSNASNVADDIARAIDQGHRHENKMRAARVEMADEWNT